MATSTLVQYLESNLVTGLGTSTGVSKETSDRSQVETFIAKETLLVGDWVAFDYAATNAGDVTLGVYKADSNSSPVRTPMGVVIGPAGTNGLLTAGNKVKVCISGVCNALVGDNSGSGNAIGTLLQITTTAGQVDLASAASAQPVCGILAETIAAAAGATQKRVVVIKQF